MCFAESSCGHGSVFATVEGLAVSPAGSFKSFGWSLNKVAVVVDGAIWEIDLTLTSPKDGVEPPRTETRGPL